MQPAPPGIYKPSWTSAVPTRAYQRHLSQVARDRSLEEHLEVPRRYLILDLE